MDIKDILVIKDQQAIKAQLVNKVQKETQEIKDL